MNGPPRWADEGSSDLAGSLFRAGRSEAPSEAAITRTLAAVSSASAILASASAAHGAAAPALATSGAGAAAGAATLVKWTALGALAGLVTAGGATALRDAPPPTPAPNAAVFLESPRAPVDRELRPAALPPRPVAARPPAAPVVSSGPAAARTADPEPVESRELAREVAAVDAARRADPARRLVLLERYRADFSTPRLGPEAAYLRMQAHLELGQRDAAAAVARQILGAWPRSPQAARARDVAGAP